MIDAKKLSVDPMSTLSAMALSTRYEDLPESITTHGKHCLLDTLAVMIAGSSMEGIPAVVDLVTDKGGKPESPLPFYGGRLPASEAAMALGPMARATDCGNLHEEAGHVSEYIVPTLLAAASLKPRVSGTEFLTALIVGQETLVRIGMAYNFISEAVNRGSSGGHYIFGAVAAVGSLLGLTQDQLENAQGIARTMTQPETMAIYAPATLMVRVHHGLVGQAAITSCLLALRGITAPRQHVLMGPNGYISSVSWPTRPDVLVDNLGTEWQSVNITTKGYSGSYFLHTAVDGIIAQMREHAFDTEHIESINVRVSSPSSRSVCEPYDEKWNPRTVDDCQFSLPFAVATAACDRELFLDAYTAEAMARPRVRELMTRITATEAPELSSWATEVTTRLCDGREISAPYSQCKGQPSDPFTTQDLIKKLQMCVPYSAYHLDAAVVEGLITSVMNIEGVDDVVESLLLPLTPPEC
jgi:2-methylcitrate dehydratase PrpD